MTRKNDRVEAADEAKGRAAREIAENDRRAKGLAEDQAVVEEPGKIRVVLTKCPRVRELEMQQGCEGVAPPPTTLQAFLRHCHSQFGLHRERDPVDQFHLSVMDGEERRALATDADIRGAMRSEYDVVLGLDHTHIPPPNAVDDDGSPGYYPVRGTRIGRYEAYGRFVERSMLEAQGLIDQVVQLGKDDFEATVETGVLDMTEREMEQARAEAFDDGTLANLGEMSRRAVDELRADSKHTLKDMRRAEEILAAHLRDPTTGALHQIANRMPTHRMMVDNAMVEGKEHLPLQKLGLAMMLEKEQTHHFGILADAIGSGKTQQLQALIIALIESERIKGTSQNLPSLVVVPTPLVKKTLEELHDELGCDFRVLRHGKHAKSPGVDPYTVTPVSFDKHNIAWQGFVGLSGLQPASHNVVVTSYCELGRLRRNFPDARKLEGLVARVICDEGHYLRNGEATWAGQFLIALRARSFWLFTGSPVVNSLADLGNYLVFAPKHEEWAEAVDRNCSRDDGEPDEDYMKCGMYYNACKVANSLPFGDAKEPAEPDHPAFQNSDDWKPRPEGIGNLTHEDKWAYLRRGRCKEWPAKMFWNTHNRKTSLSPHQRYRETPGRKDYYQHPLPAVHGPQNAPWRNEPIYDTYDPLNKNCFHCLTIHGFNFWIRRHVLLSKQGESKTHATIAIRRLSIIWHELVICRNHQSTYIDTDGVEKPGMPKIKAMTVERHKLRFGAETLEMFRANVGRIGDDTDFDFRALADGSGATMGSQYPEVHFRDAEDDDSGESPARPLIEKRLSFHHQVLALIAHPAFYNFRRHSAEEWATGFREMSLAYLVWEMRGSRACAVENEPDPFGDDWRDVSSTKRKTIVFYQSAKVGEWLHKILGFLGIGSIILTSSTVADARYQLVSENFNRGDRNYVLLCPFALRMEGLNVYYKCANVICLDAPATQAIFERAIGRVHRPFQTHEQLVTRYFVSGTWAAIEEHRLYNKGLDDAKLLQNGYIRAQLTDPEEEQRALGKGKGAAYRDAEE
ncbi:hypothetical protein B0A55_04459 [Friedmanniomyces simplex]|uniref:Helicase ATP-binding domain-containing protein n=1 Tax=Friedmanniomyces simplex TaxID=329884 RepID=A0A4U0XJ65_9PEZI|nr:hypothetical protein B0A55_04459 [Friedmanniomyces simplex]